MANDITKKSIATLIDELVTCQIKARHIACGSALNSAPQQEALKQRATALEAAINTRLDTSTLDTPTTATLLTELIATLINCFYAQEDVMRSEDSMTVASAAKAAQKYNARRNELIRMLDARLGDGAITVTAKTYSTVD